MSKTPQTSDISVISSSNSSASKKVLLIWECSLCYSANTKTPVQFDTKAAFINHFNRVCHICTIEFTSHSSCQQHRRKHRCSKSKHVCNLCEAKFQDQPAFSEHTKNHKPYKCVGCLLTFRGFQALYSHVKKECGKAIRTLGTLFPNEHAERTNVAGKPSCFGCKKCFQDVRSLHKHFTICKTALGSDTAWLDARTNQMITGINDALNGELAEKKNETKNYIYITPEVKELLMKTMSEPSQRQSSSSVQQPEKVQIPKPVIKPTNNPIPVTAWDRRLNLSDLPGLENELPKHSSTPKKSSTAAVTRTSIGPVTRSSKEITKFTPESTEQKTKTASTTSQTIKAKPAQVVELPEKSTTSATYPEEKGPKAFFKPIPLMYPLERLAKTSNKVEIVSEVKKRNDLNTPAFDVGVEFGGDEGVDGAPYVPAVRGMVGVTVLEKKKAEKLNELRIKEREERRKKELERASKGPVQQGAEDGLCLISDSDVSFAPAPQKEKTPEKKVIKPSTEKIIETIITETPVDVVDPPPAPEENPLHSNDLGSKAPSTQQSKVAASIPPNILKQLQQKHLQNLKNGGGANAKVPLVVDKTTGKVIGSLPLEGLPTTDDPMAVEEEEIAPEPGLIILPENDFIARINGTKKAQQETPSPVPSKSSKKTEPFKNAKKVEPKSDSAWDSLLNNDLGLVPETTQQIGRKRKSETKMPEKEEKKAKTDVNNPKDKIRIAIEKEQAVIAEALRRQKELENMLNGKPVASGTPPAPANKTFIGGVSVTPVSESSKINEALKRQNMLKGKLLEQDIKNEITIAKPKVDQKLSQPPGPNTSPSFTEKLTNFDKWRRENGGEPQNSKKETEVKNLKQIFENNWKKRSAGNTDEMDGNNNKGFKKDESMVIGKLSQFSSQQQILKAQQAQKMQMQQQQQTGSPIPPQPYQKTFPTQQQVQKNLTSSQQQVQVWKEKAAAIATQNSQISADVVRTNHQNALDMSRVQVNSSVSGNARWLSNFKAQNPGITIKPADNGQGQANTPTQNTIPLMRSTPPGYVGPEKKTEVKKTPEILTISDEEDVEIDRKINEINNSHLKRISKDSKVPMKQKERQEPEFKWRDHLVQTLKRESAALNTNTNLDFDRGFLNSFLLQDCFVRMNKVKENITRQQLTPLQSVINGYKQEIQEPCLVKSVVNNNNNSTEGKATAIAKTFQQVFKREEPPSITINKVGKSVKTEKNRWPNPFMGVNNSKASRNGDSDSRLFSKMMKNQKLFSSKKMNPYVNVDGACDIPSDEEDEDEEDGHDYEVVEDEAFVIEDEDDDGVNSEMGKVNNDAVELFEDVFYPHQNVKRPHVKMEKQYTSSNSEEANQQKPVGKSFTGTKSM